MKSQNSFFSSIKLIFIFIITSLFFGCGVGDSETTLNVNFVSHPSGGFNQSSAEAVFSVERNFKDKGTIFHTKDEPEDILLTIEWWWEAGDRSSTELVSSRSLLISDDSQTYSSTHSARAGYILLNYYWIKIMWEDDNGLQTRVSRKAFFEFSESNKESNHILSKSLIENN